MRKIFNPREDPTYKEIKVCSKGIGLIQRTVKVDNFSMDSCEALAEFMGETEEQLGELYGDESVLEAYGTDFKDYFLCNTEDSVVKALRESIKMTETKLIK